MFSSVLCNEFCFFGELIFILFLLLFFNTLFEIESKKLYLGYHCEHSSIPSMLRTFDLFFCMLLLLWASKRLYLVPNNKQKKVRSKSLFYYVPGQQYFIHSRLKRWGRMLENRTSNVYMREFLWSKGLENYFRFRKSLFSIFHNSFISVS